MSQFTKAKALLELIESKNSHGKIKLLSAMKDIGIESSTMYMHVEANSQTNYGKNKLIRMYLISFINHLKN